MDIRPLIKTSIVSSLCVLMFGCAAYNYAPVSNKGDSTPTTTNHNRVKKNVPNSKKHVVQRGDTLYSIAYQYSLNVGDIAKWNDLGRPYTIYPGQVLELEGSDFVPASSLFTLKPPSWWGGDKDEEPKAKPKPKPQPKVVTVTQPSNSGAVAWNWPVDGPVIRTFDQNEVGRKGVDIAGRTGQPVRATADGKVVYSGSGLVGYGKLIIIKHNDNYLSAYGFNQKLLVSQGDFVRARQKIAEMGVNLANEPVLHFEIRKNGKPVDPLRFLARR